MKTHTLGIIASLCMALVGTTVYAVTPPGGFGSVSSSKGGGASASGSDTPSATPEKPEATSQADNPVALTRSQFSTGSTVKIDGRLGHAQLAAGSTNETYVMLEMRGDAISKGGESAKVSLSIVIDKSGSMSGTRIANALIAAEKAVNALHDGDTVSVIAFDTKIETKLRQTTIDASTRQSAVEAVRAIHLGGDTCISCGLDQGMTELDSSVASGSAVRRMLLLSDGKPTSGVREATEFRAIAERAMKKGISITTVGVDVDFNEAVMTAIALGSNGRHYFVENDKDLARVFEAEAATLESSIASSGVAEIELAPGVEFVQLYDRTFDRNGSKITVPLGGFNKDEVKTVLVKVRVPQHKAGDVVDVADVRVSFRDLTQKKELVETGKLSVELVANAGDASQLDGVVLDRVQRSETAAALNDANSLFNSGKTEEARKRLEAAKTTLAQNRAKAKGTAPPKRAMDVDKSFDTQNRELDRASGGFAQPPPMSTASPGASPAPKPDVERKQKSNAKRNAEVALPMSL